MRLRTFRYIVATMAVLSSQGCVRPLVFTPSTLPNHLVASPIVSATHLNLAGLNSGSLNVNSIYPGDVLKVTVVTGADERGNTGWRLRVDERGTIMLPQAGPIQIAGLDLVEAERMIGEVYRERQIYLHPSVSMTVESRRTRRVTVDGAVRKPGNYDIPSSNADLKAALTVAGGVTHEADTIVEVRQAKSAATTGNSLPNDGTWPHAQVSFEQPSVPRIDVRQIDLATLQTTDYSTHMLEDGAVVTVLKRPTPAVAVVGLVRSSKELELKPGRELRVLGAIAAAGGAASDFADKVYVVRRIPGSEETAIIQTSIREAKRERKANLLLAAGDVVSVEETPGTFAWRSFTNVINSAFMALRIYTFPF